MRVSTCARRTNIDGGRQCSSSPSIRNVVIKKVRYRAALRQLRFNATGSAVISPNMYHAKLWETSGHWQNYKDDMFALDIEKEKWALKPMNCPGHCLIFDSRDRSYRELPIRMAEFGIIHRNEASGALTGLTRVRRFMQDDTHVFCMPSQVVARLHSMIQHF